MPIIGVVCGLVVLGMAGAVAYAQTTHNQIVVGIQIADVPVGGLSVDQAKEKLFGSIQRYQAQGATVTLDSISQTATLQQLGVRFDVAGTVDDAYKVGRSTKMDRLVLHVFQTSSTSVPLRVTIDQTMFQNSIREFSEMRNVSVIEPSLTITDGNVSVVPGQDGIAVSTDVTANDIRSAASALQAVQIAFQSAIEHPKLKDEDLNDAKIVAETMMSEPLTLTYGNRRFAVGRDELQHWIQYAFDPTKIVSNPREGIVLSLHRELAGAYLDSLNSSVGVPAKPTFGYDAEVLGEYAYKNSQGREVKVDETLEKIQPALQDASPRSVELVVGASDPPIEKLTAIAPKPAGKVIQVDVARQALLAFEDGKLKFFTRVSTGKRGYETPTGEWKIYNKTRIQRMVGQGYNLPNVKWVMPYNGDYTLHTAYWHNDFGIPKSHGCTNIAEADAKWLFDWAEVGTPVVVMKSV